MTSFSAIAVPGPHDIDDVATPHHGWTRRYELANAYLEEDNGHADFNSRNLDDYLSNRRIPLPERSRVDDFILVRTSDWDNEPLEIGLGEQDFDDVTDDIVGYIKCQSDTDTNPRNVTVVIMIDHHYRRRGIGSAALEFIRDYAATQQWSTMHAWVRCQPDESDNAVRPHRPGGGVDPSDPIVHFLSSRDFRLDIVEKEWVLDLQDDKLPHRLKELSRGIDLEGYQIVVELSADENTVTEDYVEAMNAFHRDAPSSGAEHPPSYSRDEMVQQARAFVASGWSAVESRLLDKAGKIVGLTEVSFKKNGTQALHGATWVHHDHRGKRLSLALKIANTLALLTNYPQLTVVATEIAEENEAMQRINQELGFTPGSATTQWSSFYNQRSWNTVPPVAY